MSNLTQQDIHNAMFSSKEGYVAYVIDSIEFDLDRNLTDEEQSSVKKYVDGVITTNANLKEAGVVARAALEYIDAIPAEIATTFPVMPGFDRDWAENVLAGGVPDEVLEHAAPIDRRYMVDMSAIKMPDVEKWRTPEAVRAQNAYRVLVERVVADAIGIADVPDDIPRPVLDRMSDMCDGGFDAQGIWDLCKAAIIKGQYDGK